MNTFAYVVAAGKLVAAFAVAAIIILIGLDAHPSARLTSSDRVGHVDVTCAYGDYLAPATVACTRLPHVEDDPGWDCHLDGNRFCALDRDPRA